MLQDQGNLRMNASICVQPGTVMVPSASPPFTLRVCVVGTGLPAHGLFVEKSLDSRSQLLATEPTAHNPRIPGTTDFLLPHPAPPHGSTSLPDLLATVSQQPFVYLDNVWGLLEKEAQLSSRK